MEKEYLIEKLNQKSDEKLKSDIGELKLNNHSPAIFNAWDVHVPIPKIKAVMEGENTVVEGKIVGDDVRYVSARNLIDLIKKAYFKTYAERFRKTSQEQFINKVEEIQRNLDNLIEAAQ